MSDPLRKDNPVENPHERSKVRHSRHRWAEALIALVAVLVLLKGLALRELYRTNQTLTDIQAEISRLAAQRTQFEAEALATWRPIEASLNTLVRQVTLLVQEMSHQ